MQILAKQRVATIGAGQMAEALLRGLLKAGLGPGQLLATDPDPDRRAWLGRELGVQTSGKNADAVAFGDLVVLAVKPDRLEQATLELEHDREASSAHRPLFLSILAGRSLSELQARLGPRVARAMPNTPALVGAGISALAVPVDLTSDEVELAESVLRALGAVVQVPESALDAVTGLSGSGPAYVYLFIEALTEAGIREGLKAALARELAAATVLGAARMVTETGEHPALLRERVASPAGTTIAGLAALEAGGFRAAVYAAVRAATDRARSLSKLSTST